MDPRMEGLQGSIDERQKELHNVTAIRTSGSKWTIFSGRVPVVQSQAL
jgi:hypothetical protein